MHEVTGASLPLNIMWFLHLVTIVGYWLYMCYVTAYMLCYRCKYFVVAKLANYLKGMLKYSTVLFGFSVSTVITFACKCQF